MDLDRLLAGVDAHDAPPASEQPVLDGGVRARRLGQHVPQQELPLLAAQAPSTRDWGWKIHIQDYVSGSEF